MSTGVELTKSCVVHVRCSNALIQYMPYVYIQKIEDQKHSHMKYKHKMCLDFWYVHAIKLHYVNQNIKTLGFECDIFKVH